MTFPAWIVLAALVMIGMTLGFVGGFAAAWWFFSHRQIAELDRMANMMTIGSPTAAPPEVYSPEPDAVGRARARIHEDRVESGVQTIKQRYEQAGIGITDEEARLQVESMLLGRSPVPE